MTTTSYHKTAISRSKPSAPAQWLYSNVNWDPDTTLDYGCGRGFDVEYFGLHGYDPNSGDPGYHCPLYGSPFSTILCTYVLNVIESYWERMEVLLMIRNHLTEDGIAYITVRNDKKNLNGKTSTGSWQGHIKLDLPVVRKTSSYIIYKLTK